MDLKAESVTLISDEEDQEKTASASDAFKASRLLSWPTEPGSLVILRSNQIWWRLYDLNLILIPILLIIKTVLCIVASQIDADNSGWDIDQASLLSRYLITFNGQLVTLFTIIFVAVIATFLKRLALWRAQNGARLADLEQLQGSLSLPNTLKLAWQLRSYGSQSFILLLTWSFYYLGSQAVKLEYRLVDGSSALWMQYAVQRSDGPSLFDANISEVLEINDWSLPRNSSLDSAIEQLNQVFFANLILSDSRFQLPPMPILNGPLIRVPPSPNRSRPEEWQDVSEVSNAIYASQVDIPLIDADGSTLGLLGEFHLSGISYLDVTCDFPQVLAYEAFPNNANYNSSVSLEAVTNQSLAQFIYSWRGALFDYDTAGLPIALNGSDLEPLPCSDSNICYQTSLRTVSLTCSVTRQSIDMKVRCDTSGCVTQKVRWQNHTSQQTATDPYNPFKDTGSANKFFNSLITSTGLQTDLDESTFVMDAFFPSSFFQIQACSSMSCNLSGSDSAIQSVSNYLTKGFNTYYMLSQQVLTVQGYGAVGPFGNESISDIVLACPNHSAEHQNPPELQNPFLRCLNIKGSSYQPWYQLSWPWIVTDAIACTILLAAAVSSYWLREHTIAPNIFGFVSSLTRDNPRFALPSEASTLGGPERARRLKNVVVKIGEVYDNDEVGYVSFARASEVQTLDLKKMYS